jgi:hypothetical protein
MPVQGLTVSLTTDATIIAGSGGQGILRVIVRNGASSSVYLGGSTVTTSGYPLSTGDSLDLTLTPYDALYGTSTGTVTVDVLRMNETT